MDVILRSSPNGEVILADLDKTDSSRFQNLSKTELASEIASRLVTRWRQACVGILRDKVWGAVAFIFGIRPENVPATWIGDGDWPAWNSIRRSDHHDARRTK